MKKKPFPYFLVEGKSGKILLKMKLTLLLMLAGLVQVSAISYSQATKLSLEMKNQQVAEVLREIESISDFRFFYQREQVDVERMVNIRVKDQTIDQILAKLFPGDQIEHKVYSDKLILIAPRGVLGQATEKGLQPPTVTGMVMDENGDPIIGATVMVKGTSVGTITDAQGKYSIQAPEGSTLVFSYIGYMMEEIGVNNQLVVNVTMKIDIKQLDELVVIGYGTQSKAKLATAISSINSDNLGDLPFTNPAQAMVGQIAGVRFQQANGHPGSVPYLRVRGPGSLSLSNNPLYVIDGYPTDNAYLFNSINPNEIESIDVLKDAAAASIYGSRAGNGVIIVTTKQGKTGKTKFSFDLLSGFQEVSKRYEMAGPELFVEVAKEARMNQGLPIPDFLNQPERWSNTDWQDVIFRRAPYMNMQFGASGGNEKVNFHISLGYSDDQGVIIKSYRKIYSLKASFNANVSKRLKVGANFIPNYSISRRQHASGTSSTTGVDGLMSDVCSAVPILPVWKDNGDYFATFQDEEMKGIFNASISNPLNKIDANLDYDYHFGQTAMAFAAYEPVKGLVLKSTLNSGFISSKSELYWEAFLAKGNGNTGNLSTPNLAQINANRENRTMLEWYWSNTATYDLKLNEKNLINTLIGFDLSKQDNFFLGAYPRTDVDNPVAFTNTSIKNIAGAALTSAGTSKDEFVRDAVFARVNYSYDMKYILTGSIRRDRSSRFGPESRVGIFPSIAAAWNIHREPFMDRIQILSMAKVRASYGETGNDRLSGSYPWLNTLNRNYYNFGTVDARVLTFGPTGFSNAELGWEKNQQFNIGLDVGFVRDRFILNFDVYERNSNTIVAASLPLINGKASSVLQNIGNVRNQGFEISLLTKNIERVVTWQTNFNISYNRNEITELSANSKYFGNASGYIRNYLGRPMSDIYAYRIVGTFNNEQDLINYAKFGNQGIGDLRFDDVSGPDGTPDGKIDAHDMTLIGNAQPLFTYGFTNTIKFRNFEFNLILDGSEGGYVVNQFERAITLNRQLENIVASVAKNRWQSEENPGDGKTPRAGSRFLSSNITTNSRYVYSTNFLRIRNASLGYTLSPATVQRFGVNGIRVYITATNLYTFTKYPGYNPEGNSTGDNATNAGYDLGSYPLPRTVCAGINLTF